MQFPGSVLRGGEGPSLCPLLPGGWYADKKAGVGATTFLGESNKIKGGFVSIINGVGNGGILYLIL